MRRSLQGVEANRVAIVVAGLVRVAEFGFGNPQQVFDGGVAGRNAMRLFELDQRLIESPFANEPHSLLQRRGLRAKRRGQCNES